MEKHLQLRKTLDNKVEIFSDVYDLLKGIKLCQKDLTSVPKDVYTLLQEDKLSKEFLYLYLLIGDIDILMQFIEYEIKLPLDLHNSTTLFSYAHFQHKHWFCEILNPNYNLKLFSKKQQNDVQVLRLINCTNVKTIDLNHLENIISSIEGHEDEFINIFVQHVKYNLNMIMFCKIIDNTCNETELFITINEKSLLETFNNHLSLKNQSNWELIITKLQDEEEHEFIFGCNSEYERCTDLETFKCYMILYNMIKCINLSLLYQKSEITNILQNIEAVLCSLNKRLQIDLLENIFALCFLKHNNAFVCCANELRLILFFLKSFFDKMAYKKEYITGLRENLRCQQLTKYVIDGLWRLDIVSDVKKNVQDETMHYMLTNPEYLIKMCLKNNNFEKAHQVIHIFNLHDTQLAKDIIYTENLNNLKKELKKTCKIREYQNLNVSHATEISLPKIMYDFFKDHESNKLQVSVDLLMTLQINTQITKGIICLIEEHKIEEYNDQATGFEKTLITLYNEMNSSIPVNEIINNADFNLNIDSYKSEKMFLDNLATYVVLLNEKLHYETKLQVTHKIFQKLSAILKPTSEGIKYVSRLFNYLKSFLSIFLIEGDNTDFISKGKLKSYFEILNVSISNVIGFLIFDCNLNPQNFEHLFGKLKLDLLYYLSSNCFPKINLNYENGVNKKLQDSCKSIITYVQKRNWLLAYIIGELYESEDVSNGINEDRTKNFYNYIKSYELNNLKILFNNNKTLTTLNKNYLQHCLEYLRINVFQDLEKSHPNEIFETGEEILEGDYKGNWKYWLHVLNSIPEHEIKYSDCEEFTDVRDKISNNILKDQFEDDRYIYVQFIKNDYMRKELILKYFSTWPGNFCIVILKLELSRQWDQNFDNWLQIVEFSEEVKKSFSYDSWYDVYSICLEKPEQILDKLLTRPQVCLLINFIKLFNTDNLLETKITLDYILLIFNQKEPLKYIEELMTKLPKSMFINICQSLIKTLKNIEDLQFILNMMSKMQYDMGYIKNVQISLNILPYFNSSEQEYLFCLINEPLNIIETLLMNMKLDKLSNVMELIHSELSSGEYNENQISIDSIDNLLRKYAEKSLEFRVILNPHPKLLKDFDVKLMESLDSLYGPDHKCFVMPDNVPNKSEWIPNNEVLECMCCQNTIFSMFNRRHHCRRCGRVICFNCSTRRMQVELYGDVLVRVCIDCYNQSHAQNMFNDSTSAKSILYDFFVLTDNEKHNAIVRQEFSYEHAPSVSLCLAIMKHHSKTIDHIKFLSNQCQNMFKLIQPLAPNTEQEIDYTLVIRMLKSLAIAAKMLSSECHLQWGTTQADRMLTQADLLGLLAERGCLNLLPSVPCNTTPFVDATILRRLRDKLLEKEQWNFALEVSTKAGLDNAVVFAAWGKNCLKSGCLQLAREKFQRCFDWTGHYDLSENTSDVEDGMDSTHRKRCYSKISTNSESMPLKTSSLLNQIIEILEAQTVKFDLRAKKDSFRNRVNSTASKKLLINLQADSAILIKYKLHNLKSISSANYSETCENTGCKVEPIFFQECIYYLNKYGNHLNLLQFYFKHNYIHDSLHYIIENDVSMEVFIELYMMCLKDGKINILQDGMHAIDSSLDVWKDYLRHICRHLEKQLLLHSLYQLQQFMGDFVRAAMTCIRFYKENATSYRELHSNIHFLDKAEIHLKQEKEQQQWVEVNAVDTISTGDNVFEEKALTNPSLVMKMDPKHIENHIKTIKLQTDLTNFLASHELREKSYLEVLSYLAPTITGNDMERNTVTTIPTLFDTQHEKIQIAILAITCSENIEEGHRIAFPIIQNYKLKPFKVYCQAGRLLAKEERYNGIALLVSCIKSSGLNDAAVTDMCDEMLAMAVRTLCGHNVSISQLETLVKLISDKATKISVYIETKQLKSAYLLAAKYNRIGDIRRILREAELLNKHDIKKLCQKLLQACSHSPKD